MLRCVRRSVLFFFFSSRRRHTRCSRDWSSDVCSSDLGVTIATHVSFGLVAIVIGVAVAKGIVMLTGGKRAQSLQVMSVMVAAAAYAVGPYLTKRTFILEYLHRQGKLVDLPLVPTSPSYFFGAVSAGLHPLGLVLLPIFVAQAWESPAPLRLPRCSLGEPSPSEREPALRYPGAVPHHTRTQQA